MAGRTGRAGQGRAPQRRCGAHKQTTEQLRSEVDSLTAAADGYCFQQWSQGSRFICQAAARPGSQVAR
jgi:hypothetical protein